MTVDVSGGERDSECKATGKLEAVCLPSIIFVASVIIALWSQVHHSSNLGFFCLQMTGKSGGHFKSDCLTYSVVTLLTL